MTSDARAASVDGDLSLVPTSGQGSRVGDFVGFAVARNDERIGTLAFRHEDRGIVSMRWNLDPGDGLGTSIRVITMAIELAFGRLGAHRVQALVPTDHDDDIRAASICGLRREGIVRTRGAEPDRVLMGRLIEDPPLSERDGFIAILNAGLPTKRVIGQGVWRDATGRVLLCELTYKQEWDLPGGVVEVGESPSIGLLRELHEELGVEAQIEGLITVNWLPAWRGWDDACVFVFDLGVADEDLLNHMTLQQTEIRAVHWCDTETVHARGTAATIELLDAIATGGVPAYREAPASPE